MLLSANEIIGYRIRALDGDLGKLKDVLFDDVSWKVRYLHVDTGRWLPGRQVLLSPESAGSPEWQQRVVRVNLTQQQVQDSPDLRSELPVSRQHEEELARYYRWAPYWMPGEAVLLGGEAAVGSPPDLPARGDPHLRGAKEVKGYVIRARDQRIGHVDDFILDTSDWSLRYLVVDTRNWLPGRKVLISPAWVTRVDWLEGQVGLDLTATQVKSSPEYNASAPVNRAYEEVLYDYYGRPTYWK